MKRPGRPMFRVVLLLLAWATAGAIVNVAVAWGCAVVCRFGPDVPRSIPLPPELWALPENQAKMHALSSAERSWIKAQDPYFADRSAVEEYYRRSSSSIDQVEYTFTDVRQKPGYSFFVQMDFGWPLRSIRSPHDKALFTTWGKTIDYFRSTVNVVTAGPQRFRLIWPGFAINTLFYAAILWLLFAAPFALRKRRRIKRD